MGVHMRNMTEADCAELADIEADQANAKLRRKRFFTKLRQRAYRERKASHNAS